MKRNKKSVHRIYNNLIINLIVGYIIINLIAVGYNVTGHDQML